MIEPPITADLDFEKRWQEGIKDWNGQIPERMISDEEEEGFWSKFLEGKHQGILDDYTLPLREAILADIRTEDSVVEIGPGWGNYTFPLLDKIETLNVVDSSKSVLDFLSQNAEGKSLKTHNMKWENFQQEELFDVVIGVNCFYRMFEIKKAIKNMNAHAKRLCIIGLTTGPLPPHYKTLEDKYGYRLKHPRRDYIDLLHVMYECGIYADCNLVPLKRKTVYASKEEAVRAGSKKIIGNEADPAHVEDALSPYLKEADQGFVYEQPFYGSLLTWKPHRKKGQELHT